MIRNSVLFVALGAFTLANAADKLAGGPYVVHADATSATVGWVLDSSATAAPSLHCEKVKLKGLKPGTTVQYEVPPAVRKRLAPEDTQAAGGAFKTAPKRRADFQAIVFGDTRSRHDLHRRIIAAMVEANPDFVVHTGDLVADGSDMTMWPTFFEIERQLLRKTVFYPVLGNHERNNEKFHDFFETDRSYYSFDWGAAHFTLINSDVSNVSKDPAVREAFWKEQTRWLENDLAKSRKADFRFVVMHHPPFTVNTAKGGHVSKETPLLVPMFEKYKVSAVLAGHDHNYQRHVKNGIQYIVTGGGGAPLAGTGEPIAGMTQKVESTEHFVNVKVQGKRAQLQAVALDGRTIDSIEIH